MSKNPLISIVIPFYNVERYLPLCLRSVMAQTYENLQIVCVDDASTDGSVAVVRSLMDEDSRIVLVECEHGGVSQARNAGLDACEGDYIMFVDSDDVVSPAIAQTLFDEAISSGSDLVMCDYIRFERDEDIAGVCPDKAGEVFRCSGIDAYKRSYSDDNTKFNVIWGKLYRASLFSGIRYPKGLIHEDEFVTYKTFLRADRVSIVDSPMVFYRQRPGSIMDQTLSEKNLVALDALQERLGSFLEVGDKDLIASAADYYIAYISWFYCDLSSPQIRRKLVRRYRDAFRAYKQYLPASLRFRRLLFLLSPGLFCKMYQTASNRAS